MRPLPFPNGTKDSVYVATCWRVGHADEKAGESLHVGQVTDYSEARTGVHVTPHFPINLWPLALWQVDLSYPLASG